MKKISFLIITGLIIGFAPVMHAQKVVLKSGSLASLNTMSDIRVEYTYDNMMVGKM